MKAFFFIQIQYICNSLNKIVEMPNFTRILIIAFVLGLNLVSNAQDLHVTGGAVYVSGPVTTNRLEADLYIENSSTLDLAVLVDRDITQLNPGHANYYCWALCYDTTVSLSPDVLVMPAQMTDSTSFHSYIYTHNIAGTSSVTYTFFNQDVPSDATQVTIVYDVLTTGINSIAKNNFSLSSPSPNPANSMTGLTYSLPINQNSKLLVRDLLGNLVKEYTVNSRQGVLMISTSELANGIYSCTLVNSGASLSSTKLIVSHH